MAIPFLQISDIHKSYEGAPLLDEISFEIAAGEILCLLGPSGTGKTTLLRIIAGLESAESGAVRLEGRDLSRVPVHKRGFGLMFQDLALFPHQTVAQNVAFGLRMQNATPAEIRARVVETLELVGLEPARFGARDVNRLSGGEQQRVALARSLAPRPRFLMFDEPLGALDRILREQLVVDLRELLKRIGMTVLYVTHDQEEAFAIADRVAILHAGRVEQIGTPREVYLHPASAFVARFLGLANILPARVISTEGGLIHATTPVGRFSFRGAAAVGQEVEILLRPGAALAVAETGGAGENIARGRVIESVMRNGHTNIVIESEGHRLTLEWEGAVELGSEIFLSLDPFEIQTL